MNQKCKTNSSLSYHISPSGIFVGYRDSIRNDGLAVQFLVAANVEGPWTFFFGKYLRSKQGLVSRRQEGFVDEIVCLPRFITTIVKHEIAGKHARQIVEKNAAKRRSAN